MLHRPVVEALPASSPALPDAFEAARSYVRTVLARHDGNGETLERQVQLQALTAELATGFIGLTAAGLDAALAGTLERLALFMGAEGAVLALLDVPALTWRVTHGWTSGATASSVRPANGRKATPWSLAELQRGNALHMEDPAELPPQADEERKVCEILGVRSLLVLPLCSAGEKLLGLAAFATTSRAAGWSDDELPMLDLVAQMLRSAFEQHRQRTQFEHSELRLRKLLESGAIGILAADSDGRIWEANDAALLVLGASSDDVSAGRLRWDAITPAEFLPMTMGALEQLERCGCSQPWEQDVYRPDGSRVSVLVCLARIAETPAHFLVYAVDITVDKQAQRELALRYRLARLITLFSTRLISVAPSRIGETIEEALRETGGVLGIDRCSVWIDADGLSLCTYVWDRVQHRPITTRPFDRFRFKGWDADFRARRAMVVRDVTRDYAEETPERKFLESYGVSSGVAVPLIGSESPVGFVTFACGRVIDWPEPTVSLLCLIGEIFAAAILRGRTEERQRLVNAELEARVAERTLQLENANRELESFSYAVSHDLRAPLRGVDGFSRILVEDHAEGLPDDAKAVLDRIRITSQRMGELIDALLKLSRITRSKPQFERTDLTAIARELVAGLAAGNPQRRVDVRIEEGVVVDGEPRLLSALMENLLGNAWKFTAGNGRASIEFGCERRQDGLVYFVRDDGVGFEPSQAERIFMPFQRLHDPRDFEGHGVGLATVKRIVGIHGGRVWGSGEPGKGATIRFTLGKYA